jgi:hypothetical protein
VLLVPQLCVLLDVAEPLTPLSPPSVSDMLAAPVQHTASADDAAHSHRNHLDRASTVWQRELSPGSRTATALHNNAEVENDPEAFRRAVSAPPARISVASLSVPGAQETDTDSRKPSFNMTESILEGINESESSTSHRSSFVDSASAADPHADSSALSAPRALAVAERSRSASPFRSTVTSEHRHINVSPDMARKAPPPVPASRLGAATSPHTHHTQHGQSAHETLPVPAVVLTAPKPLKTVPSHGHEFQSRTFVQETKCTICDKVLEGNAMQV